ncbi:MAG: SAM-dependent chlorinase/fluorinase [Prevotellaceae bacterium]|jgi:S-adenosylmethionine hydrolase|nr:SAM-dependent chlorinase/fluorinase [Prevotellaceae bacterium]
MAIVTLTTDWGVSDFYVGALKGHILSLCPQAHIVDISHDLSHLEALTAGAYKLRNAYPFFPAGSVHVVGVRSEDAPGEPFIAVESRGHLFICKNNGFLSLALDDFVSATAIASPAAPAASFSILHAVPPAVQKLLQGAPIGSLGQAVAPKAYVQEQPLVRRRREGAAEPGAMPPVDAIIGHILHIDSHGNIITNIARELFYESAQGRTCTIFVNSHRYRISQVSNTYADVKDGEPVAFFNAQNLLEIAFHHGNASHLYRLDGRGGITIEFNG